MVTEIPQLWQKTWKSVYKAPFHGFKELIDENRILVNATPKIPETRPSHNRWSISFLFVRMIRKVNVMYGQNEKKIWPVISRKWAGKVAHFFHRRNLLLTEQWPTDETVSEINGIVSVILCTEIVKTVLFFFFLFFLNVILLYCSILYGDFWRKKEGKK